ncbi:MAG: Gldg family protein [Verrucomicrobiota bacterium]|nr:Gldg family protein [Verrucomicrobiota bacterium]
MALLDNFTWSNRFKQLNRALQILLALTLMSGLNYVAGKYYWRDDLSAWKKSGLSPESLAYVRDLPKAVKIIVTLPRDSNQAEDRVLFRYTKDLLDKYEYASRQKGTARITLEYVDVFRDLSRTETLRLEYGLDQPYLVLFVCDKQRRTVVPADIMEFRDKAPVAFKGEQAFTSALLEVVSERTPTIYFLAGHGEMLLDDTDPLRGLSEVSAQIKARNFSTRTLDLTQTSVVPQDAGMVVICDPQGPLGRDEVEKLRRYLADKAGRVMVILSPARKHGLNELFYEWGLLVDDMVVLEMSNDFVQSSGNLLLRNFGDHPITGILIKNQTPLLAGLSRPVREDIGAPLDERLKITPLAASSSQSWAERNYSASGTPRFDAANDLRGPISVAAVAERRVASQLGINLDGGRLIVFGTSDLMSNRMISAPGNLTLVFSTLNWAFHRDQLLTIPPKPIDKFQISLSPAELRSLASHFAILPLAAALLGLAVWWARRI